MNKVKAIQKAEEALRTLGLNQLEAEVYVQLLRESTPQTAYRLGQIVGRPTANVYKAIESLQERGAVTVQDGDKRLCTAVPASEFLAQVQRDLRTNADTAEKALAMLEVQTPQERVVQLTTVASVFERAIRMLDSAEEVAVLDAFPKALEQLVDAVERAVARKVRVYVQVYSPTKLKGATVVLCTQYEQVLRHWNSEQLNLVVDGKEALVALLRQSMSDIHQATWTNSLYLSCMLHVGFIREHTFHAIARGMEKNDAPVWLKRIIAKEPFFHTSKIPGQVQLFKDTGVE